MRELATPVLAVVEDVHWARAGAVRVLLSLVRILRDAPVLLVVTRRPHPGHPSRSLADLAAFSGDIVELGPLDDSEQRELLTAAVGVGVLPIEVEDRILEASSGNPFFLEEPVGALRDRGQLVRGAGGWSFEGDADVELPDTVERVLLERIDQLDRRPRSVLDAAAVVVARCAAGSILDLAQHLAWGQGLQAEAWQRLGTDAEPHTPQLVTTTDPDRILAAVREQHERFVSELEDVTDEQLAEPVPMSYGTLPGVVVLHVAVMEAGVHRSDLEEALGRDGLELADDTLDAIFTLLPGTLPQLSTVASERPAVGTGMRLVSTDGPEIGLRVGTSGWEAVDDADDWSYVVRGGSSAVALFALGRISADHDAVSVDGDRELARRFQAPLPWSLSDLS